MPLVKWLIFSIVKAMVVGGHLENGGHIEFFTTASISNMFQCIKLYLCAKFHACYTKGTICTPFCNTSGNDTALTFEL